MPLASHSTATIAQVLSGIDFPANRQKLVDYAQKNNADPEVLDAIRQMPLSHINHKHCMPLKTLGGVNR